MDGCSEVGAMDSFFRGPKVGLGYRATNEYAVCQGDGLEGEVGCRHLSVCLAATAPAFP